MDLFLYGFIAISFAGLLLFTWTYQVDTNNRVFKRIEFLSIVMTFFVNVYLTFLLRKETENFREMVDPILGSGLMVNFFFFSFYVSFFYMILYSAIELYNFSHLRIVSIIVFLILSVNFMNILYRFYYEVSLDSYYAIGPFLTQILLLYVSLFSVYQVISRSIIKFKFTA